DGIRAGFQCYFHFCCVPVEPLELHSLASRTCRASVLFLHQAFHALVAPGSGIRARDRACCSVDRGPRVARSADSTTDGRRDLLGGWSRCPLRLPGPGIRPRGEPAFYTALFRDRRRVLDCPHLPPANVAIIECIPSGLRTRQGRCRRSDRRRSIARVRALSCLSGRPLEAECRFLHDERRYLGGVLSVSGGGPHVLASLIASLLICEATTARVCGNQCGVCGIRLMCCGFPALT